MSDQLRTLGLLAGLGAVVYVGRSMRIVGYHT